MPPPSPPPPPSILIIGAGVFGLSTTLSLLLSPRYTSTHITLLDTHAPSDSPNPHAASTDTSRIIRPDYSNSLYTALAHRAQHIWRHDYAPLGIYHESGLAIVGEAGRSGWDYILKSRANVASSHADANIQDLTSPEDIAVALHTGGSTGLAGYLNPSSGWADATAAMAHVRTQVSDEAAKQGRQLWRRGKAVELLYAQPQPHSSKRRKITGVRLASGETLPASLVILAAGAWSGALLDLRGRVEASAQVVAYVSLTDGERARLQSMPVVLNLASGLFAMPPAPAPGSMLKVARHGYGYRNPTPVTDPITGETRTVSLPASDFSPIPAEGERALRGFLREVVPWLGERGFAQTRLCWYADTPGGDFVVDWVGGVEGLFVAGGGSGHAFKFLGVLGGEVLEALEGRGVGGGREGGEEGGLRELWAWGEGVRGWVGTEDGSRGGRRGMLLEEEWERGREGRGSRL